MFRRGYGDCVKRLILLTWSSLAAVACFAGEPIQAALEARTNRAGWFVMHITNVSSNGIGFLDVPEGTGWCGEFYEVTVERDGQRSTSNGNCYYAPAADPTLVQIAPGHTYDREIQPAAYLYEARHTAANQVSVTYRLSAKIKQLWISRPAHGELDLVFHTDSAATKAPQGGASGRQPFSSESNRTPAAATSRRSP